MATRRKNKRFSLKNTVRILALFLVILLILLIAADRVVRPVVLSYAENIAEIKAAKVINGGVQNVLKKQEFRYGEYIEIVRDQGGRIIAVSVDTVALNILISDMILTVQNDISAQGTLEMNIPLGNLTGSAYLLGRGPRIPMKLTVSTAVKHSVTSEFSDAGVNQTLHRMVLHINMGAYVAVPFYTTSTTAEIQIPLAETVIVGDVPDAYTVVIEGTDSDFSGKIFDYGADMG